MLINIISLYVEVNEINIYTVILIVHRRSNLAAQGFENHQTSVQDSSGSQDKSHK